MTSPLPGNPAPAPAPALPTPQVVIWYKVYCGVVTLMYLLICAFSLVFFFSNPEELDMEREEAWFAGFILLAMGLVMAMVSVAPLFLPPRPWVWIYGIVIIALGLSSCCLPACVPLLIFWLKSETQAYFGRKD